MFQKRWPGGASLNAAADFISTEGGSGNQRSDQRFELWLKGEWNPDSTTGASYQIRRQSLTNDPVQTEVLSEAISPRNGVRTDFIFSLTKSLAPDPYGLRLSAGLMTSSWTDDSMSLTTTSPF